MYITPMQKLHLALQSKLQYKAYLQIYTNISQII